MAFLCPSRLGRNKQKSGYQSMMRRLTDRDMVDKITLEDLVKLSWTTPESRRIIMQNFTSNQAQEVNVKQGQKVNYIYREGDWAYIVTDDKKEGFVPFIFLAKIGVPSKLGKKVIDSRTYSKGCSDLNPRNFSVESEETDHSGSDLADDSLISPGWSTDSGSIITVQEQPSVNYLKTEPFEKLPMFYEVFLDERTNILHKNPLPSPGRSDDNEIPDNNNTPIQFKVMFNFSGLDLYDVSVKVGDIVDLLDGTDPGWFLVRRADGYEGYVPSNYITQLHNSSVQDTERSDSDTLGSTEINGHAKNIRPNNSSTNKDKKAKNEIPITWKVTNDLKGKSPITTARDITEEENKLQKKRPKKPPRKKKTHLDGLSPRLDESLDSIDTFITESSTEYIEGSIKSPLDGLSPRSDYLSDSSVFESSFNGVYGYRQCASALSESPRSLNVQSYDGSASEDMSSNDRPIEQSSAIEKDDTKIVITNTRQTQESNHHGRKLSYETSDSFESRSSYGQRQKRPVSLPAFRSYQEYKKDYYDEYFYDDADTKFAEKSKHDVINVAEILKMRNENKKHVHLKQKHSTQNSRNSEKYLQIRKSASTAESKSYSQCTKSNDAQNQPKLKQFLLDLPSTKIEKQTANINRCSGKSNDDVVNESIKRTQENNRSSENLQKNSRITKNVNGYNEKETNRKSTEMYGYLKENDTRKQRSDQTRRQYNSSTDLRQMEASTAMIEDHELSRHSGNKSNKINENKRTKDHLRPYNSSTDLRELGVKPDWSFGYPRKTRRSIGRQENGNQCNEGANTNERKTKSSADSKSGNNYRTKARLKQDNDFTKEFTNFNSTQNIPAVNIADKSLELQIEDCNNVSEDACFDDEAMMALLNQTNNLLSKTDVLLHRDRKGRIHKEEANKLSSQSNNLLNNHPEQKHRNGNKEIKSTTSSSHHSKVETDAVDKCNLFINNSTIGIHGMTYFVTSDNESADRKITTDASEENFNSDLACNSLTNCQSVNNDSRKEKSSVMKDNSSKVVSEEIKSMDLHDIRGITEFVCQCDNENDNEDTLPIIYGEVVHIGLDGQDNGDKYWAFSPRLKKYGFVLKQNVKIPMVTII